MGVYSPNIIAAKEEYITTYKTLKDLYEIQGKSMSELKKDLTLRAVERKLINLDVSAGQIRQLEKTKNAGRLTFYHSPISGVIIKKNVLQGSHIKAGQELFRIANLSSLWVFIHIFEKDLRFVKKGQKVTIKSGAYPDKAFHARIDLIYPFFNMETRDVKVRIILPNTKQLLRPGMYVNVAVESKLSGDTVTIPDQAIIYSGEKNYVFVSLGKGKFEVRPITILTRSEGKAVITKGLEEKELVVANGQFLLDSEASLKGALQKGETSGGHSH